ncbi:MAG: MG2 domain-containing protein [Candidatus Bathyarchaeia archaeon]
MSQVFQGETVSREYVFRDRSGVLLDPDSISVKVVNAVGQVVATPELTRTGEGVYELHFNVPEDAVAGVWEIYVTASKGAFTRKHRDSFEVLAAK